MVTGIPQTWKVIVVLRAMLSTWRQHHGFRSAIFSPEMKVVPVIRNRFRSIHRSKSTRPATPEINAWIEDSFVFIGTDPMRKDEEDDFDLDWIIDKATEAVLRDGIRILLIDPWNEVEHARGRQETMTEYVARGIRALKRFARKHNVAVIVVAHPVKMERDKKRKAFIKPTLYDISDSSAWYNKCDHGLVIYRDFETGTSEIEVLKSRFDEAGEPGMVKGSLYPGLAAMTTTKTRGTARLIVRLRFCPSAHGIAVVCTDLWAERRAISIVRNIKDVRTGRALARRKQIMRGLAPPGRTWQLYWELREGSVEP